MGIKSDNARIAITINKELLEEVKKIAYQENRTVSNLVVKILKDYIKGG